MLLYVKPETSKHAFISADRMAVDPHPAFKIHTIKNERQPFAFHLLRKNNILAIPPVFTGDFMQPGIPWPIPKRINLANNIPTNLYFR